MNSKNYKSLKDEGCRAEDAIRGAVLDALIDSHVDFTLDDESILFPFFESGMRSHGPNVETVTMPVADFVAVLREYQNDMQSEIDARAALEAALSDEHFAYLAAVKKRDQCMWEYAEMAAEVEASQVEMARLRRIEECAQELLRNQFEEYGHMDGTRLRAVLDADVCALSEACKGAA
jgi:hypothetical protein